MIADAAGLGGLFRPLLWEHIAAALGVFLVARVAAFGTRAALRWGAEAVRPRLRLTLLRLIPVTRLAFAVAAVIVAVPILIEPTLSNVVALIASVGLGVAFALKEYVSSLVAGVVTVLENTYQPGDWITVDGVYGEVTAIDARAVRIVTADDTAVIVPHSKIWSTKVANATSGNRGLLCVISFYLDADHDGAAVQQRLGVVAQGSAYWRPESAVTVVAQELPWGTHYKVKAYVKESRAQFDFITDVTIRGKAALRAMGIRFARVPYAETRGEKAL